MATEFSPEKRAELLELLRTAAATNEKLMDDINALERATGVDMVSGLDDFVHDCACGTAACITDEFIDKIIELIDDPVH